MTSNSKSLCGSASLFAMICAAAPGVALAQAQPQPAQEAVQEVVVTGSRVIQNGNNSPTPVTVVAAQDLLQVQPTTISAGLNLLPVFNGSQTQAGNAGNNGQNTAASQLNLRNLGAIRTLIQFDGQRLAPLSSLSGVDTNLIPQMLLQRVDVVTGGVSAVYGSDGVAGVVNFITDKNFNGLKFNASMGVSEYSDDPISDVGIAGGRRVNDKIHIEGSYEFHDDVGIMSRLVRPYGQEVWAVEGAGTVANPFHMVENARLSTTNFNGVINNGPLAGQQFVSNGVLGAFNHGTATGTTGVESGGDGGFYSTSSQKAALASHQVFGRFDYDFSNTTHAYVEATGSLVYDGNRSQLAESKALTFSTANPFLTPAQQAAMSAGGISTFTFSKMLFNVPSVSNNATEKYLLVNAGVDGELGNYKWDAVYSHQDGQLNSKLLNNLNLGHYYAAIDAVKSPTTGQPVCRASLTNANYANCVPLNLFGPTSESAAAVAYIEGTTQYWTDTSMDSGSASFTGAPISTWAGPINMALSGEVRRISYHLVSNATPNDRADCAGIAYNCTATTAAWNFTTVNPRSPVSQTVGEVAYEFDAPLLKDMPFAEGLNLNGAIRETNYNTSGSVSTWKIGADWHVNDELTIRATRSRDIRAPNIAELFAPPVVNRSNYADPHTGVSSALNAETDANPNLKPEIGDTTTAGFVWKPSFLPRFSMSVDAYHIDITQAIITIQATSTLVSGACEASNGASPLCALFVRPLPFSNRTAANYPTALVQEPLNIASIDTYGADVEANYAADVFNRPTTFRLLASWQPHERYDLGPGGIVDMGGATTGQATQLPTPQVRITGIVKTNLTKEISFTVLERWRSAMHWSAISTQVWNSTGVPPLGTTTITIDWNRKTPVGPADFYLNIQNLFDVTPPPWGNVPGTDGLSPGQRGGYLYGDDATGRYFTVGVRLKY